MKKKIFFLACATLIAVFAPTGNCFAKDCVPPRDASANSASLGSKAFDTERCDSLISVWKKLFNRSQIGGRQLEEKQALNPRAAQQEIDQARMDPSLRAELDKIQQSEVDPWRRQLLEAALFDDEGLYLARDLRLQELQGKLK